MMDENRGNLFGLGSANAQKGQFRQLSPYLNIDPSYLQTHTPEFIVDNEMKRGRLENSFSAIGSALFVGAAAGGFYGLFDGVRTTAGMSGKLKRTQILNHTLKSGASIGNSLGAIALMYSSFYALFSLANEEESLEDARNCLSGAITGALYKSGGGLKKSGVGAAVGLGLSALWSFGLRKNETVSYYV